MQINKSLSLLMFNRRVLEQGKVSLKEDYSYTELKQKLFFNKVFLSNIREMFSKGLFKKNNKEQLVYLNKLMRRYQDNISNIISIINANGEIISEYPPLEIRLKTDNIIREQMFTDYYLSSDIEMFYSSGKEGLHFLGIDQMGDIEDATIIVDGYIDNKHTIFGHPFKLDDKYYTTIGTITSWMNRMMCKMGGVCYMHITNHQSSLSLIEYSQSNINKINFAALDAIIIYNKYPYIDDIIQILDDIYPESPEIKSPEFKPIAFEDVMKKDVLIEYPRDTFDEFLQFISQTTRDDIDIESLSITLYRIGNDPKLYYLLADAAGKGIEVNVNLEMRASGEDINQFWYNELVDAGVNVYAYKSGILKVHAKLALIKFRDGRMISHIGTGNYHTKTTSQYTDLSLMTADMDICASVENLFEVLFGKTEKFYETDELIVTQYNAEDKIHELIISEGQKGKDGLIVIKCNSLDDDYIIEHLDWAAQKGCEIKLIIRGICTWIPTKYLNKNVMIKSVIWDKLEHSRVFSFGRVDPDIYIGSLDLVSNKIYRRIEAMVKINSPDIAREIVAYLNRYINAVEGSWLMNDDGLYYPIYEEE